MSAPLIFSRSISFVYWVKNYLIEYMILLSILWLVNTWVIHITVPKESSFAVFMLPFSWLNLLKHIQLETNKCLFQSSWPFFGNVWFSFDSAHLSSDVNQELTPWSLPHKGESPGWLSLDHQPCLQGDGNHPKKRRLFYLWVICSRFSKNSHV